MLDELRLERVFHDMRGVCESAIDVPAVHVGFREQVAFGMNLRRIGLEPVFGVCDRRTDFVIDDDLLGGGTRETLVLRNDDRDHVADAPRLFADRDQDRPVFDDQADVAVAGTSAAVMTRSTPGIASEALASIDFTSARG